MIQKIQRLPPSLIVLFMTILIAFGMIGYGVIDRMLTPKHPLIGCWETSILPMGFRENGQLVTTIVTSNAEWRVLDEDTIEIIPILGGWGVEDVTQFEIQERSPSGFWLVSPELIITLFRPHPDPERCRASILH